MMEDLEMQEIDDELCWRRGPEDTWKPYTTVDLTSMLSYAEYDVATLKKEIERLKFTISLLDPN
jgi:hypothetical protein